MATRVADPTSWRLIPVSAGSLLPLHSLLAAPNMETRVSKNPLAFFRLFLALGAALLLAGCSEPVSMNNYNRIQTEMSQAQVYEILGEPDSAESIELGGFSGTLATWEGKKAVITIQIFNGEVFGKQYSSKPESKPRD